MFRSSSLLTGAYRSLRYGFAVSSKSLSRQLRDIVIHPTYWLPGLSRLAARSRSEELAIRRCRRAIAL